MPLDSNLPTYYFKPPTNKSQPFDSTLLFTQFDSDPEPRYILRHPDPSSPTAKNCYAAALFDAYIPDVVFGEILVRPEWTHSTLSADEIRKNGGVPPPPAPVMPKEVTVQLYAPDQQIIIEEEKGSWGSADSYSFHMPQQTFRLPSASSLDYGANDPAADATTPQINFVWKRDGRKDLKCCVTGKSTDKGNKKKGGKEPPIIIAIFSDFRDLTIYEPNLQRVDMEDYKGLEVVLLLSATVVRDMWCGQKKDVFNAGEAPRKNSTGGGLLNRKSSMPLLGLGLGNNSAANVPPPVQPQPNGLLPGVLKTKRQQPPPQQPLRSTGVPAPDPRQQWEIDAETARLTKLYASEQHAEEARRKEKARRDEDEQRRIKKMLEQEDRERRKQQSTVDKESMRLMKMYGNQGSQAAARPVPQSQRQSAPSGWGQSVPAHLLPPRPQGRPPQQHSSGYGPYLQSNGLPSRPPAASQSSFLHGSGSRPPQSRPAHQHAASSSVNLSSSARPPQPPRPTSSRPPQPPRPASAAPPDLRPKKSSFWGFLGSPEPRLKPQKSVLF
jgi:hypothetical protein